MKNNKTMVILTEKTSKIMKGELCVELIPVREMPGYEKDNAIFDAYPRSKTRNSYDCSEAVELARKLAKYVDEICVARVQDSFGEYYISEICVKGLSKKFKLFNAEIVSWSKNGQLRVITPNTGRGALSYFWYDKHVIFKKGCVS